MNDEKKQALIKWCELNIDNFASILIVSRNHLGEFKQNIRTSVRWLDFKEFLSDVVFVVFSLYDCEHKDLLNIFTYKHSRLLSVIAGFTFVNAMNPNDICSPMVVLKTKVRIRKENGILVDVFSDDEVDMSLVSVLSSAYPINSFLGENDVF